MADKSKYLKLEFIKVKQPIGSFYITKIPFEELIDICYADIREIQHEGDFETYLGIQRDLDPKRIADLNQYVNLIDATFPTSVILSISNKKFASEYSQFNVPVDEVFENIKFLDENFQEVKNIYIENDPIDNKEKLFIKRDDRVAKIIDGQHRIEGLRAFKGKKDDFDVNVTIFQDMDIEEQAIVFSTINKAQTKVNKSRVYDLYDLAKSRSPQKTCHNIAKYLNKKEGSPFLDVIKILGKADDLKETITQATFVECLLPYISRNPVLDRDIIKRGDKLTKLKGPELSRHFFRNLFIEGRDAEIARNLFNYFNAVKTTWPRAWAGGNVGDILNKSTGLVALFRFFKDVYLFISRKTNSREIDYSKLGDVYSFEMYYRILGPMNQTIPDDEFTSQNFDPGGSGRSQLYRRLNTVSNLNN